jgi:hypothetical protein
MYMYSFGASSSPRPLSIGGQTVHHGDVLASGEVLALHEAGVVWDTAQGWFVNREVAFRPAQSNAFQVVDLAHHA